MRLELLLVRPHRVHNLQRCGLLLLMFCGLCVCICLSVSVCLLDTIASPIKMDETIKMLFGVWTQVCPRNHVLGGGLDPIREGAVLGVPPAVWPFFKFL